MKIRRYFSILIFSIFLVSYAQQDISPGSEIGDAIFRTCVFDTPQWINLGHTAIYFCSEGFFEWDTQDDLINSTGTHSVIQATGEGVELGYWPFSFFLEEYTQWGNGYTARGGLPLETRKTIINIAKAQYGAPYPQLFNEWYYPKIMTPRNMAQGEEGCFRCDGLVEYCYEQVGIAFFSEEEKQDCWFDFPLNVWPTFYPKALMDRMTPEAPTPPELEVTSPEDGDLIEDDVSIEFTADDGSNGSGIDIIYIFIDNKLVHKDDEDSDGGKEVEYDWDCSGASEGTHYIKIDAYDRAGNLREKEIKVYKGEAPIVVYTAPSGKSDVHIDIKTIVINFSREMDKVSTEGAVKIEPSLPYTTSWFDESTLDLNLSAMLDYCKEYTITISGTATDTIGVHLDGNGDGRPGDPYPFSFTTESPELSLTLTPATDLYELKNPGNCQSKTGNITINGSKLLKEVTCNLSKTITGSGLGFSCGKGPFTIPVGGNQPTPFTVTACNEGGISVNLEAIYKGNVCGTTVGGYSASLEKEKDHPDDNQSPGVSSYPASIVLADDTLGNPDKVGIFIYGWTIGYAHLLGKYGIPIEPVFSDFTYWKNPDTLLSDEVKLVVIGSGALSGFNSHEFEQKLEDYVVNGGNLLVFTQKYGADLSVLPGEIGGYGWNEDQSCFKNAAYLNQWHPVFAGQTRQLMTCNVDGYISEYPTNAEVLLGRTKNDMPALLYYNYGAGTVIVTSMYTDWGYGHNQRSGAELNLIRDLTTWALNPEMEIPEFYSDSSVSVPVSIEYLANDTVMATTAIIKVYTPDRKLYDSTAVPVSLNPGGKTEWVWNAASLPENLGLWIIDYALMDGSGDWVQGYNRGAIFAQKEDVPVGDYNLGDFQMWATSDKEEVMKGNMVNFGIFVKNNTSSLFTGKIMVGVHEDNGSWWKVIDSFPDITIPSDSIVEVEYKCPLYLSTSTSFGLYKNSQYSYNIAFKNALARCQKGVWVIQNPFLLSLSRDKSQYVLGVDSVHYRVTVGNKFSDARSPFVNIYTLLDSVRYNLWSDTVELSGEERKEVEGNFFPMDYDTTVGKEKLCCDLFYKDSLWNSANTKFYLTYPNIQCSLALPDSFNYGDSNRYTVTLTSEADYIPSGKLLVEGINFSDSLIIDNVPAPETTFVFDYQPDAWEVSGRVSNNKLKVQYQYGDKTVKTQKNLPFRLPLISAFRPDYPTPQGGFMPEDTAVFNAQLALTGNLYGVPLEFCLWSDYLGADTLRDTIILDPCSHRTITLKTYTDMSTPADTLISYNYRMNYLNKEYTTTEELQYSVLPPEAVIHWPVNDTFSIGNTIPITFTNSIKVPSRVDIEAVYLRGDYNAGDVIESFDGPGEVEVPGGGSYIFPITVPEWKSGQYRLDIRSEMVEGRGINLDLFEYGCPIYIDGIEADIQVSTPKDYYGYGEDIPFSSLLENGKYGWNGTEALSVYSKGDTLGQFSIWDITEDVDTFGLVDDGSGGLVLDPNYSLKVIGYAYRFGYPDEWGNLWVPYNEDSSGIIEKWDGPGCNQLLARFELPNSITDYCTIAKIIPHQGMLYILLWSEGIGICKLNSTSGEIEGFHFRGIPYWGLRGIALKENGNVLALQTGVVEEGAIVWELSSSGDSISTFTLPGGVRYNLNGICYKNGTIYITTNRKIITIEGEIVDSFGIGFNYLGPISVGDNGKIATLNLRDEDSLYIVLFSEEREFETWINLSGVVSEWVDDITFYNEDILAGRWYNNYVAPVFGEFGKENGLIRAGYWKWFNNLPKEYRFLSYKGSDAVNSGSILYQSMGLSGYPGEEDLLPLENLYGSDYLLPIFITMQGDWHDSPVFYDCLLNLKVLNVLDSLIVKKGYDLNLSPSDNVSFADTIKDTIPPCDYCILGEAYSEYPQSITSDWKLFTVIGDDLTLLLKSDKEEGFVEDTFRINPITVNPLPLEEDSLHLLIKGYYNESETTYVDTSFVLLAETTDSFPFIITPEEPLIIKAELITPSDTIRRDFAPIIKSSRMLLLNVNAPEVTDLLPFSVISEVYNYSFSTLPVEVKRIFLSDTLSDSINLEIEGAYTFVDSFVTTKPGTLKVIATTGSEVFVEEKFIDFGFNGIVVLDSLYRVSPDSVEMNGIVSNEGLYTLECKALFCLVESGALPVANDLNLTATFSNFNSPHGIEVNKEAISIPQGKQLNNSIALSAKRMALSSVTRVGKDITLSQFVRQLTRAGVDTSFSAIYLPPGKTDTIPIMFNRHDVGSYELQAFLFTDSLDFMFDSTSSHVNVVGENQVLVDSLIVSENCDSNGNVLLTAIVDNQSYSSFSGNLTINSLVCYLDSVIETPSNSKDTVMFKLTDPIDEGEYPFTATITEGGVPVSEKIQNLEFHPVYRFDSLPINLTVSTPDSGIIEVLVSNIGNARGERRVAVNLADVISIREDAVIEPAASDTFSDNFLIPEDFPGGEYFADASILKNFYPEVDTFFNVKINGLVIQAEDSLDKLVYSVNDTAELSILIENQSLWSGNLLASLQYGELEIDTSFILGGMEKGVLNETFPRDTIYLDTSGIYMFDPINSESYDSVRIDWNASLSDSLIFQMRTDSLIGREDWITLEKGGTYVIDNWMQINFANKSPSVQWIDAICLFFNSLGCIKLDTFPLQREIVTFEVPVDSSENKLGWGIYYPSGRSVVLDERYVYLSDSMLTLFTDKSRYEIFDTVYATLCKNFPDTNYNFEYRVYFSPTEEIRDSFDLEEDTTRFSFVIPDWTRSGTYSIDYWVDEIGTLPLEPLTATLSSASPGITNLTAKTLNYSAAKPEKVVPYAKQWVLGKPKLSAFSDSAFISGEHLFDVDGITVYFKNAKMDTNLYFEGETAKIRTEISSDIDLSSDITISSTASAVNNINLNLKKDIPNKFEFEYPITGCRRGMNELYLHLAKDSVSLAGCVLYFDVYVSDTIPPAICVLEEPSNTYSSNRTYQVKARIYDPDTNGTPFHDTLYYRILSSGGSDWNAFSAHSVRGDTNKYLIPSQPNGTHIEYNLIARDEFGNRARYPEEGNQDFWVLSPLKPTWSELLYSAAPSAVLRWNSPEEFVYYHCGLCSDTVNINETEVATRFTSQYSPARLTRIGLEIINESAGSVSDTLIVSVYPVEANLLPGVKIDSFAFTDTIEGYTEFSLSDIDIPEGGIFAGIKGSSGLSALLDGYGQGSHTAINSGGSWELATSGELLMDGIVSHVPPPSMRGPSDILSFDVLKSTEPSIWTKIASGLTGNLYTDTLIQENREYFYKIMVSFGNPVDSFFSTSRGMFIDFSPPELDTVIIDELDEDRLLLSAAFRDTSGIAWDSLGYKNGDTINVISEDSCKNNEYFFSITFSGDTLAYFLKVKDLSLIGNYARYPESGFYKWGILSGITEVMIPDSTCLYRMLNVLVGKDVQIRYALSEESNVEIMFFDIMGRKVETLVNETKKAGYYSIPLRPSNLPHGVYFLRMWAGDYQKTLKLVKVK